MVRSVRFVMGTGFCQTGSSFLMNHLLSPLSSNAFIWNKALPFPGILLEIVVPLRGGMSGEDSLV